MSKKAKTLVGLEVLRNDRKQALNWGRCAYVCNQASMTNDWVHGLSVIYDLMGDRLTAIFSPQHGLTGTVQDNMIETDHSKDPNTGLPVYSLYSETREPTEKMLQNVDTIIVDLQIVGCRIYTFKSTIAGCLRSAKQFGKKVVILDRPNPLGGEMVEGRCVEPSKYSFVGQFTMPMRHGLTAAEAGLFFNGEIGADLDVIPLENWNSKENWYSTMRTWVMTSPNLPAIDAVIVYPGMVIFEGSNVSEGRGTALPFQILGAPYCPGGRDLIWKFSQYWGEDTRGEFVLRPIEFQPTSGKWKGITCRGVQIHLVKSLLSAPYHLGLALLKSFWELSEGKFAFSSPPYEYEYNTMPMKIILGGEDCVKHLEAYSRLDSYWSWGIPQYIERVQDILLYDRKLKCCS